MTNYYTHFTEAGEKLTRPHILHICSNLPLKEICHTQDPVLLKVARWEPNKPPEETGNIFDEEWGGWECHGDVAPDHRGINAAQLLFVWNGLVVPYEARYFPFSPIQNCPGAFHAISRITSNPRLDRLLFSEAGDEVTLYRLHAYDPPGPVIINFKKTPEEQIPQLIKYEVEAFEYAEEFRKELDSRDWSGVDEHIRTLFAALPRGTVPDCEL